MKSELEQCKAVLTSVLAYLSGYGESEKLVREIRDILYPEPEYEDVEEIVGWVNVYPDKDGTGFLTSMYKQKEHADNNAASDRISCQPIKVIVKREKKAPVERSVTVEHTTWFNICEDGEPIFYPMANTSFDWSRLSGKAGTLTFTWQEKP